MKKVLIVDDVRGWREQHLLILRELLGEEATFDMASSAQEGYDLVYNNLNEPYDLIVTDLQMESDFAPKYAGEWLVEQIKLLSAYATTRIVLISATYNIRLIAEGLNVRYISKIYTSHYPGYRW